MDAVFWLLIAVVLLAYFFDAIEIILSEVHWVLLLGVLAALAFW